MAQRPDLTALRELLKPLLAQPPPTSSAQHDNPLLLMPSTSRESQRAQIQSSVDFEAQHIGEIELIQSMLVTLKSRSQTARGRLQYLLSPFSSLPVEIITQIFELATLDDQPGAYLPNDWIVSVRISHVCSAWRRVSLAMPILWTCLAVASWRQRMLLDVFLERLGRLGMHLEICASCRTVHGVEVPSFVFAPNHDVMRKLASLRLFNDLMHRCFSFKEVPRTLAVMEFSGSEVNIDESLKNAEHLGFYNASLGHAANSTPSVSFRFLRSLKFRAMDCAELSLFWDMSKEMVRLQALVLEWIDDGLSGEGGEPLAIIHSFPALERLDMHDCCVTIWESLRGIAMPLLRDVSILMPYDWDRELAADQLGGFLSRRKDPLDLLHLGLSFLNAGGLDGVRNASDGRLLCPEISRLCITYHPDPRVKTQEFSLESRMAFNEALELQLTQRKCATRWVRLAEEFMPFMHHPERWYQDRIEDFEVIQATDPDVN